MRRGTIYRRCTKCGRKVPKKTCPGCGYDRSSWAYVVDTGHVGGKRRQQSKSGFATKAEASTALANVQVSVSQGTHVEPARVTVGQFLLERWLPAAGATVRPTTLLNYEVHVRRHVIPHIGEVRLQLLTGADLNRLYAGLTESGRVDGRGGLAATTVHHVHATIHRALRDAVRWGLLVRNPADAADPPRRSTSDVSELRTWTAKELSSFLSLTEGDRLHTAWVVLGTTGLRRGELLGLKWTDIDLDGGQLSVRRALVAVGYETRISEPKTRRGRRVVSLDQVTVSALRNHRKQQLEERMAWGPAWHDTEFVFTREDGTLNHPSRLSKQFEKLVDQSGLPRIRLHDLRHTHATLALMAGIHPKVVSERLGHANVSITLDTYSHAIPAMQADAAERIAALVFD